MSGASPQGAYGYNLGACRDPRCNGMLWACFSESGRTLLWCDVEDVYWLGLVDLGVDRAFGPAGPEYLLPGGVHVRPGTVWMPLGPQDADLLDDRLDWRLALLPSELFERMIAAREVCGSGEARSRVTRQVRMLVDAPLTEGSGSAERRQASPPVEGDDFCYHLGGCRADRCNGLVWVRFAASGRPLLWCDEESWYYLSLRDLGARRGFRAARPGYRLPGGLQLYPDGVWAPIGARDEELLDSRLPWERYPVSRSRHRKLFDTRRALDSAEVRKSIKEQAHLLIEAPLTDGDYYLHER